MRRAKWHQLASCLGNGMEHFGQGFEFSKERDHVPVLPTPNMRPQVVGIWSEADAGNALWPRVQSQRSNARFFRVSGNVLGESPTF